MKLLFAEDNSLKRDFGNLIFLKLFYSLKYKYVKWGLTTPVLIQASSAVLFNIFLRFIVNKQALFFRELNAIRVVGRPGKSVELNS